MTDNQIRNCFLGYLLCAILTFGVSYNLDYDPPKTRGVDINALRALMCGAVWPVYWAQVSFRFLRPTSTPVPAEQP